MFPMLTFWSMLKDAAKTGELCACLLMRGLALLVIRLADNDCVLQEARIAIVNAHASFLATTYAEVASREAVDSCTTVPHTDSRVGALPPATGPEECDLDFRQLAAVWQAPLYELNILKAPSESISEGR